MQAGTHAIRDEIAEPVPSGARNLIVCFGFASQPPLWRAPRNDGFLHLQKLLGAVPAKAGAGKSSIYPLYSLKSRLCFKYGGIHGKPGEKTQPAHKGKEPLSSPARL